MSSNLVSGMFQRLDKLNKYAFASVCICGEDNNMIITGVWIMRGQEVAFDVSCFLLSTGIETIYIYYINFFVRLLEVTINPFW